MTTNHPVNTEVSVGELIDVLRLDNGDVVVLDDNDPRIDSQWDERDEL